MVAVTKMHKLKQIRENISRTPKTKRSVQPKSPAVTGPWKFRRMLSVEVFRQASSGPTPVKNSNINPRGIFTLLKKGAPTLMREPVNHSEKTGNRVPESTATQATSSTRLLNKKLDSRDTSESSWFSLFK